MASTTSWLRRIPTILRSDSRDQEALTATPLAVSTSRDSYTRSLSCPAGRPSSFRPQPVLSSSPRPSTSSGQYAYTGPTGPQSHLQSGEQQSASWIGGDMLAPPVLLPWDRQQAPGEGRQFADAALAGPSWGGSRQGAATTSRSGAGYRTRPRTTSPAPATSSASSSYRPRRKHESVGERAGSERRTAWERMAERVHERNEAGATGGERRLQGTGEEGAPRWNWDEYTER